MKTEHPQLIIFWHILTVVVFFTKSRIKHNTLFLKVNLVLNSIWIFKPVVDFQYAVCHYQICSCAKFFEYGKHSFGIFSKVASNSLGIGTVVIWCMRCSTVK